MKKRRTLETKAAEVIMQKIYENGEMETEEIMDLIVVPQIRNSSSMHSIFT